MNPGQTFDRVYAELKRRILAAHFRPGARIDPAQLTDELAASITPVRDALYRLAGERLVLALPALGFRMPLLTEPALRDLYDWNEEILLVATSSSAADREAPQRIERSDGIASRTARLFEGIASGSDNAELRLTIQSANDRLHAVRTIEAGHIHDTSEELEAIETAWRRGEAVALRRGLHRYHRRRHRLAGTIIHQLNRED